MPIGLFSVLEKSQVLTLEFPSDVITDDYLAAFNEILLSLATCLLAFLLIAKEIAMGVLAAIISHEQIEYIQVGQYKADNEALVSHQVALNRKYSEMIVIDKSGIWSGAFAEVEVNSASFQVAEQNQITSIVHRSPMLRYGSLAFGIPHDPIGWAEIVGNFLYKCTHLKSASLTDVRGRGERSFKIKIASHTAIPAIVYNVICTPHFDPTEFSPSSAIGFIQTLEFQDLQEYFKSVKDQENGYADVRVHIISGLVKEGLRESDIPWNVLIESLNLQLLFLRGIHQLVKTEDFPNVKEVFAEVCYDALGQINESQPNGVCLHLTQCSSFESQGSLSSLGSLSLPSSESEED